jgi:hypothetical protein
MSNDPCRVITHATETAATSVLRLVSPYCLDPAPIPALDRRMPMGCLTPFDTAGCRAIRVRRSRVHGLAHRRRLLFHDPQMTVMPAANRWPSLRVCVRRRRPDPAVVTVFRA